MARCVSPKCNERPSATNSTAAPTIVGFELGYVTITDPHVIATSGSDRHPILRPTDRPDAAVEGMVFAINEADLAAADDYEVDDYRRVAVPLRSGEQAWVYVFAS